MSNRLHQKHHRSNHHSLRPTTVDPKFPDAGYDPIASFNSPFEGEFFSKGNILTTETLSAGKDIHSSVNMTVGNKLTVGYDISANQNIFIERDANIKRNLGVGGNLNVDGETTNLNTAVYITSSVEIQNKHSTKPSFTIKQTGQGEIANFFKNDVSVFFVDGSDSRFGHIGLNATNPSERLTVVGNVTASGNIYSDSMFANLVNVRTLTSENINALEVNALNNIRAEQFIGNSFIGNSFVTTQPTLLVFDTVSVQASSITTLPFTGNDLELSASDSTTITKFVSGLKGACYTLTNISTAVITISSSPFVYIRSVNPVVDGCITWKSRCITWRTKPDIINSYIKLPPNFSCSLRCNSDNMVSVW